MPCTAARIVLPQGPAEIGCDWQGVGFGGPEAAWEQLFNIGVPSLPVWDP